MNAKQVVGNEAALKAKLEMLETFKGGVIMDVVTPEQARIAEDAGAVAVMALERVPSDIRKAGGVARMSPPELICAIRETVKIPVMAKCRIGHFAEAQVLQEIGVDFIDESEVLTPADEEFHINKHEFHIPFVCGATCLGEALRRIGEGAMLIRTKGEPGTGNIVEAVRHLRKVNSEVRRVVSMPDSELMTMARETGAPYELLLKTKQLGRLPVPNFSAGGVSTPADAALVMQLGAEAVFVGSGIFKSEDPEMFAKAIVKATGGFRDAAVVLEASKGLPKPMEGMQIASIEPEALMATRGW